MPRRAAKRSHTHTMQPYSWSVRRTSPGSTAGSPDATRLIAADTLDVNTNRSGRVPRNAAVRSRAAHRSGGRVRTRKLVGPSASWRRSSVARSNTGRGTGPNDPALSMVTAGSSMTAARAADQSGMAVVGMGRG